MQKTARIAEITKHQQKSQRGAGLLFMFTLYMYMSLIRHNMRNTRHLIAVCRCKHFTCCSRHVAEAFDDVVKLINYCSMLFCFSLVLCVNT